MGNLLIGACDRGASLLTITDYEIRVRAVLPALWGDRWPGREDPPRRMARNSAVILPGSAASGPGATRSRFAGPVAQRSPEASRRSGFSQARALRTGSRQSPEACCGTPSIRWNAIAPPRGTWRSTPSTRSSAPASAASRGCRFSIRVLLESLLRNVDGSTVTEDDVAALAGWNPADPGRLRNPFPAGARRLAGLHRRSGARGSRRDAFGDRPDGRRSVAHQPAGRRWIW